VASITIRDLDDSVKRKLRVRAAQHGRSMEEEARNILRTALAETPRERT
jgi:plasmid stability protein